MDNINEPETNMGIDDAHKQYTKAYIDILNTYNSQLEESTTKKHDLKENFFKLIRLIMIILIILFIISVIVSFAVFVLMIIYHYSSVSVITGAITAMLSTFATIVLSIFKLPKIIADYLFNKEEDAHISDIIKNIQKYELDAVKLEKTAFIDAEKEKSNEQNDDLSIETSPNNNGIEPESLNKEITTSP